MNSIDRARCASVMSRDLARYRGLSSRTKELVVEGLGHRGKVRTVLPPCICQSGILVFSVRIGLFGSWGPFKQGRVGVPRLVVFPVVKEFVEESMHARNNGRTTGIAGEEDMDWGRTSLQ